MLLSKKQLLTHHTAGTDDARPVLQQVYVYKDGEDVVAVSTDSYVLAEVRQKTPPVDEFPLANGEQPNVEIDKCFISKDVAKKALGAIPKKYVLPVLGFALAQKDEVITSDLDVTTKFKSRELEGNFPDYLKLIPEPAEKQITFNPDKMKQVMEVFKDITSVTIEFGEGKLDPVVFRANNAGAKITAILMPLRS